jgi:hypothetical protein
MVTLPSGTKIDIFSILYELNTEIMIPSLRGSRSSDMIIWSVYSLERGGNGEF